MYNVAGSNVKCTYTSASCHTVFPVSLYELFIDILASYLHMDNFA